MSTDTIGPILTQLLSHATSVLSPPVGRSMIAPGAEVAWDDCCDGQVWVRVIQLDPLGTPKLGGHPCARSWQAVLGIGVLRCVAVMDDSGKAPPPATQTAAALQILADEAALAEAIGCQMDQSRPIQMMQWLPLGPAGGCAGGEWTVAMVVNTHACPEV